MRIAFFQRDFPMRGGVERVLDNLIAILRVENEVALFTLDYHRLDLPSLDSVTKYLPRESAGALQATRETRERRQLTRLATEVKNWKADVVVLNKNCGFAGWLSNELQVPLIAYVHDAWSLHQLSIPKGDESSLSKKAASLLYHYRHLFDADGLIHRGFGRTRLVVCPSRWLAGEVRKVFPDANCVVIPHGVNHSYFAPTWEDHGYALCSGRMHPEKNYELAIKAASLIGFPLVICGSTGRKEPHVLAMKYVEELKAIGRGAARFVLDVRDDEYVKLLQGCSVYLNPGKKESFGLAPLEAMACGKPVVALDAGGTREVVEGGGILVGGDPKDWGREVDRLMKSRSLRNKIGKAAWEHSKQFTWEKTAKELVGAIRPFVGAKT